MKVVFLGTGTSQGVPVIGCKCRVCQSKDRQDNRLRSSLFIMVGDMNILIDIGPDFRYQILRLNESNIGSILFTHHHRDHTAGLDDLRPIYYLYKNDINLYGENNVYQALKSDFKYLFSDIDYPGKPKLNFHLINNKPFKIDNTVIKPIRAMHHNLPILGYRIGGLAYITDANYISDEEKKKLFDLDVLILNSLQKEKHISHYNLEESLNLISLLQPKTAYLTHIGHGMGLHRIVNKELPKNIFLAYDGLEINL